MHEWFRRLQVFWLEIKTQIKLREKEVKEKMDEVEFLILHKKQALAQEEKKNQALREKYESFAKPEEIPAPHLSQLQSLSSGSKEVTDENRNPNEGVNQLSENPDSSNTAKPQAKLAKKASRNSSTKNGEKARRDLQKRTSSQNQKPPAKKKL